MTGQVVVTDQTFGDLSRERELAHRFGLEFTEHQAHTEAEAVAAVTGARLAFVNLAPISRRVLGALGPGTTLIRYGVGYDNVDIAAASEFGVQVCNVPDYGSDTVADHAVTVLLSTLRKVIFLDRAVREQGWLASSDLGSIAGFGETTVGLIGTGRIGRAVAGRLRAFKFHVLAYDPFVDLTALAGLDVEVVELDELLERANALSLHAPLTEGTHHILNSDSFSKVRRGAVIVNTARGGLIDEHALAVALRDGRLGGAALDVFETEPLPLDSELRDFPNVLLTPHTGYFSDDSSANLQRLATEEAERALSGKALRYRVN